MVNFAAILRHWMRGLAAVFALFVFCMAIVAILGWIFHQPGWTQFFSHGGPVQLSTDFALMGCAVGILALIAEKYAHLRTVSGLVLLLVGITLCEYLFQFKVADLFLLESKRGETGPLEINTALCVLLIAGAEILASFPKLSYRHLLVSILGVIVAAIAFVALMGYLGGLESAYEWNRITEMPMLSSICLLFLGGGLMFWAWDAIEKGGNRWFSPSFSIPITICLLVMSVCLWEALRSQEYINYVNESKESALYYQNSIARTLKKQVQSIQRMAYRWNLRGGTPRKEWVLDAKIYSQQQEGLTQLDWIDRLHTFRWMAATVKPNIPFILSPKTWALMEKIKKDGTPLFNPKPLFKGTSREFLLFVPLFSGGQFDGFLVGHYDFTDLVKEFLDGGTAEIYPVVISVEGVQIYPPNPFRLVSIQEMITHLSFRQYGLKWQVNVGTNELLSRHMTFLPAIALGIGVIVAVLFLMTSYFGNKAYQKSLALEETLRTLKEAQSRMVQQEKLASLGHVTAGIAHEIKNPLSFINMFSELSQRSVEEMKAKIGKDRAADVVLLEPLATLEENLNHIHLQGKRAASVIQLMLSHAHTSTKDKSKFAFETLLEEYALLALKGMQAENPGFDIEIAKDLGTGDAKVIGVSEDIGRVILNLIQNALYSVEMKAKTGLRSYRPKVKLRTSIEGKWLQLIVEDNGLGVPEWAKEKVFTPFFTTKPTGQGTGLGLSISHHIIVQEHHGEMEFSSCEGEGARFIIRLPYVKEEVYA